MKTTPTIALTRSLMLLSIGLLVMFQVFWIKKSYDEQLALLRKQSDNLFQQSVRAMQDSVSNTQMKQIFQQIKSKRDTVAVTENLTKKTNIKSKREAIEAIQKSLKKPKDFNFKLKGISIKVEGDTLGERADSMAIALANSFAGLNTDTSKNAIKVRVVTTISNTKKYTKEHWSDSSFFSKNKQVRAKRSGGRRVQLLAQKEAVKIDINDPSVITVSTKKSTDEKAITFSFYQRELDTVVVHKNFTKVLKKNNLPTDFTLIRLLKNQTLVATDTLVKAEVQVRYPFESRLVANFRGYKSYLWWQILPQIGFGTFLVLLTSLAFGMMYRNWQQQHRLTALKNDFIGNVTHELKTPIATVSVALEALQNFNALQDPQRTQEYLAMSQQELGRLSLLADKILKINTFEGKYMELKFETIDLKTLIESTLKSLTLQFEKLQAEVTFNTDGHDFTLQADAAHLTSVVYNLIDNALKYSPKAPKIAIDLTRKNERIHVTITDSGVGIAPEFKTKIFEKFFRVPTGNHHNIKGYGLGLSYVAEVVKQHSGHIEVESEEGVGSRFTVVL